MRSLSFSAAAALRHTLLWGSRRRRVQRLITASPVSRTLVRRFVAGETVDDAIKVTRDLAGRGLTVSLDHLGEDTHDAAAAAAAVTVYSRLVGRLGAEGLAQAAEVSVKLSALGQALDRDMALDGARAICAAARDAGTKVTIDMEGHTTTEQTLAAVAELRREFPSTGAVLQASLRRSEADCRALSQNGSRVRLCKGAYQEPAAVAWQGREEVRSAFLRCLSALLAGGAYTMLATHDPALINAAAQMIPALAPADTGHEYQMLYGIRPDEQ